MLRSTLAAIGLIASALTLQANAAVITYTLPDSNFSASHVNGEGSSNRVPGGEISGSFSIDTDSGTLAAVNIDTNYYSIHGPLILSAGYRYGVAGETDDRIGTQTVTIGATHVFGFSRNLGLTVDLTGNTAVDLGGGDVRNGSYIQILDVVTSHSTRLFYPRLSLFFEDVDLLSAPSSLNLLASEYIWNVNRGNGRAGDTGWQGWTPLLTAQSDQAGGGPAASGNVPLPSALLLLLGGLLGLPLAYRKA